MSGQRRMRAWLMAAIVALALTGGIAGSQAIHSAAQGTTNHQVADGPPIWPPVI